MVFSFWERVMRNGVGGCPRGMLSRVKTNVNGEGDAYYPFRPILAGKLASASLFGPCHGSHTQRCRPHASWSRRIDLTWEGYERLPRATFSTAFWGKRKNVRSSSPPSRRLVTTPGQRLFHVRSKAA